MANVLHACDALPAIMARAELGTINHTLQTIEALHHRNMEPAGIVFMNTLEHTMPDDLILESMEAVSTLTGIPVNGVMPPEKSITLSPAPRKTERGGGEKTPPARRLIPQSKPQPQIWL